MNWFKLNEMVAREEEMTGFGAKPQKILMMFYFI